MYYILQPNIALRSWRMVPYGYYIRHMEYPKGLKKEEFDLLLLCDGEHELEKTEGIRSLLETGMIFPCKKGEYSLSEWQKHKSYDNRLMPKMRVEITGRCNYNCLHCFNAVDNTPLQSELTLEEIAKLLDAARECGVNGIALTGGEPLIRKDFREILAMIYERNLYVPVLNTNGFYITQELLDYMKSLDCNPQIQISFDGLGHHDWMRGYKGAEEIAIRAMGLCIENGFSVMVNMQLNRKNKDAMPETLDFLDSLGVAITRVIRTTESPRWEMNEKGLSMDVLEYYDTSLELARNYMEKNHSMELMFWQFMTLSLDGGHYSVRPQADKSKVFRESLPLCQEVRGMLCIGANGAIYPCLKMSGYMEAHNWGLGNIKTDDLKTLLQESDYMKFICQTVHDRMESNGKCKGCQYLRVCGGGCPALGLLTTGDILGPDLWKCAFFEHGYPEKIERILIEQ